jgi:outer membrane receptor for ferrienterochelin and colicins
MAGAIRTIEPSGEYGGSDGNFSYFVTGDMRRNDLGIESPDGSTDPLHDHSTQAHGFGYFEDIIDPKRTVFHSSSARPMTNFRYQTSAVCNRPSG